jgi:hypothetical protein
MTPVFAFIQAKRAEINTMGITALGPVSKKATEMFKALPAEEQAKWQQRYEKQLKQYASRCPGTRISGSGTALTLHLRGGPTTRSWVPYGLRITPVAPRPWRNSRRRLSEPECSTCAVLRRACRSYDAHSLCVYTIESGSADLDCVCLFEVAEQLLRAT